MTNTPVIARIREALEACRLVPDLLFTEYRNKLHDACNPAAMTAVLTHIDAQAAERLRADAARYQWLRRNKWWLGLVDSYEMDRELDEAMKEQP